MRFAIRLTLDTLSVVSLAARSRARRGTKRSAPLGVELYGITNVTGSVKRLHGAEWVSRAHPLS
jgi:hypothetical protein